jgi:hypothetical protein
MRNDNAAARPQIKQRSKRSATGARLCQIVRRCLLPVISNSELVLAS